MARLALRELCGYRAGDKGDVANVALFADDDETYALIVQEVTAARVKEHFGAMVHGRVDRYEAANVRAQFVVLSFDDQAQAKRAMTALEQRTGRSAERVAERRR